MDTTALFLFLVFFVLGYAVREFIGGSKKDKSQQGSKGDTVLRFWLDEQKVQHVEMEGEEVSITDATSGQRKRLADLLKVLQKWAGEEKPQPVAPVAPAAVAGTVAVASAVKADEPPLAIVAEPKEATKPRIDLAKGAQMFFSENVSRKVEPKPKTIVGMIDEVLQKKLETSPLQSKKISLEDGPHGEVIVVVDADRYVGVDQVPDPQVQAIIREATAEWDHTQS
jgi:hypothetical protein